MKTIAQEWARFEELVMPAHASESQRRDMRCTFYAGFSCALLAGTDMANESGDDDDAGVAMLERLHQEYRQFAANLVGGNQSTEQL